MYLLQVPVAEVLSSLDKGLTAVAKVPVVLFDIACFSTTKDAQVVMSTQELLSAGASLSTHHTIELLDEQESISCAWLGYRGT